VADAGRKGGVMTDLEFYETACKGDTIGHFVRATMAISNPDDAARFYRGCVANVQKQIDMGKRESKFTATEAAYSNIGWCFGEGMSDEKIAMWCSVCGASNPVFGKVMPTLPTP
jgi:hypothetical protein